MFKALSSEYKGRVIIGEARKAEWNVFQQYGPESIPALLQVSCACLVCTGSVTARRLKQCFTVVSDTRCLRLLEDSVCVCVCVCVCVPLFLCARMHPTLAIPCCDTLAIAPHPLHNYKKQITHAGGDEGWHAMLSDVERVLRPSGRCCMCCVSHTMRRHTQAQTNVHVLMLLHCTHAHTHARTRANTHARTWRIHTGCCR